MPTQRELLGKAGSEPWIEAPFHCDYGANIKFGDRVYFNFNCVILDLGRVVIGSRCLFGPSVQIYTATHPLEAAERAGGLEGAKDILIGDDVWVGGGFPGKLQCPRATAAWYTRSTPTTNAASR